MYITNNNINWGIDAVVTELEKLRNQSLENRLHRKHQPKLPSKTILKQIVDNLAAALFPNRLGLSEINDEGINFFVGHTLESVLHDLNHQIGLELLFIANQQGLEKYTKQQSAHITREFTAQLPKIRTLIDSDILAAYEGDPAARSTDEVLVCYPGIYAVIHHRIAHQLYRLGAPLVARIITEVAHSATGIDIHPGAQIADSFFIDHGTGVVIGETAILGRHVRLYQAVTLGAKSFDKDESGMLVKGNARHPILEDDVVVYAGATILGRITIGRGSTIGGNVWLTHSVPPGSQIRQAKVRSTEFEAGAGI